MLGTLLASCLARGRCCRSIASAFQALTPPPLPAPPVVLVSGRVFPSRTFLALALTHPPPVRRRLLRRFRSYRERTWTGRPSTRQGGAPANQAKWNAPRGATVFLI